MLYLVYKSRAHVLICALVLMVSDTNELKGTENLIAAFLQKFIKPFLRSANIIKPLNINRTMPPPEKETALAKLIRTKIKELKPVLQDNDEMVETEDNLTLHGNDETTLIEFLPRTTRKNNDGNVMPMMVKSTKQDPLKVNINKYKMLREQIKEILDEEMVAERTKSLILTTLDEMIAQMIESQCNWTSDRRLMQHPNETNASISKVQAMSKKQWKRLREQYMNYLTTRNEKENAFMDQFHQFFSNVINDTNNLSDRYRIRCQLVQIQNESSSLKKTALRKPYEKNTCENFKLCSDELRAYFVDFYNYVNDTAVSVFRNYASMYVRDVNIDFGVNKDIVVGIINNLGNMAERKVTRVYKHELRKFKLDPDKNKNANVRNIKSFIRNVTTVVKQIVKDNLKKELDAMKTKLFMTIKEDLCVNFDVDMENLERHYIDNICMSFMLCNGRYSTRRVGEPWTFRPKANSEVFVKVQLSLDDEMKNVVARSGLLNYFKEPNHAKFKLTKTKHKMRAVATNYLNITVTRTSIGTKATSTTRAVSSTIPRTNTAKDAIKSSLPPLVLLYNTTQVLADYESPNLIEILVT